VETNSLEEGNINDALIDVYKNDTFFETLSATESGWYHSLNTMVLSGNKYKAVSHTYLGEMMAETFVPTKSEFQINYRIDSAGLDTDGDQFDEISLSIYDDLDNVNFYEIILKVYNIQAAQYNFPFYAALSSNDEAIMREGIQNWGNSLLFSDKGFNGLEKQILIQYALNGALDNSGNLIGYDYDSEVIVNSITEDYYLYKKSLKLHLENQQGEVFGGDPVSVYSNVQGGLGIFAGYASEVDTIKD
jgi:hypothetical protein